MEALAQIMLSLALVTAFNGGDVAGGASVAMWALALVWGVQNVSARFGH